MEIRVYYKDTDAAGVVYYAHYLDFFEIARTEYMRQRGLKVEEYAASGLLFVVVSVQVDYKSPARYGDILCISTKVSEVGAASFVFQHQITHKADKRLIVEGSTKIGCVNKQGRPVRLPLELVQRLKSSPQTVK